MAPFVRHAGGASGDIHDFIAFHPELLADGMTCSSSLVMFDNEKDEKDENQKDAEYEGA